MENQYYWIWASLGSAECWDVICFVRAHSDRIYFWLWCQSDPKWPPQDSNLGGKALTPVRCPPGTIWAIFIFFLFVPCLCYNPISFIFFNKTWYWSSIDTRPKWWLITSILPHHKRPHKDSNLQQETRRQFPQFLQDKFFLCFIHSRWSLRWTITQYGDLKYYHAARAHWLDQILIEKLPKPPRFS